MGIKIIVSLTLIPAKAQEKESLGDMAKFIPFTYSTAIQILATPDQPISGIHERFIDEALLADKYVASDRDGAFR